MTTFEDRELRTALEMACEWFETDDPTAEQLAAVKRTFTFAVRRLSEEMRLCGRTCVAALPGGKRLLAHASSLTGSSSGRPNR